MLELASVSTPPSPLINASHGIIMALSGRITNVVDHVTALFNWLVGLIGIFALMAGLALLPSFFGKDVTGQSMLRIFEIALSNNILGFFPEDWSIGILVVATVLFTWVCLLLSMSTHSLIVAFVDDITFGNSDAERAAWGIVLVVDFILSALFVFILFGGLMQWSYLLIWSLLMLAVIVLLIANYSESRRR